MGALWQMIKAVLLVLNYYIFSISLTFYNKKILTDYPFPICITIAHLLLKFLIAWFIRHVTGCVTKTHPRILTWREYMWSIAPVAVFSSLDIGLSNWSLVYITVSLYTMSKSTALIFILFFAIFFKLEKPHLPQVLVVLLIFTGLFMFTYESTSFEWEGFLLVLLASVVTGLRWSTAQLTIQKEELGLSSPIDIIYNLQPVMIITLIPLSFFVDAVRMATSRHLFLAPNTTVVLNTLLYIAVAALIAFMLALSEYLLVYHTSGLTLSISGVFKEVIILTVSTTFVEDASLGSVKITGMVLCVLGVTTHSVMKAVRLRGEEMNKKLEETSEDRIELIPRREHSTYYKDDSDQIHDNDNNDLEDDIVLYETRNL